MVSYVHDARASVLFPGRGNPETLPGGSFNGIYKASFNGMYKGSLKGIYRGSGVLGLGFRVFLIIRCVRSLFSAFGH